MERIRQLLPIVGLLALMCAAGCKSDFVLVLPEGHPARSDSSIGAPPIAATPYDASMRAPPNGPGDVTHPAGTAIGEPDTNGDGGTDTDVDHGDPQGGSTDGSP